MDWVGNNTLINSCCSSHCHCHSSESTDSERNELERSLKKITRLISVPENEKLEEENKVLLTR